MINNTLPIKFIYLLSFFFITIAGYSQLPAFTLTVTSTPQSCLGNGSLSFTVNGNNPAATMSYAVYLLPNTTTPVTLVTAQQANGLVAGNYQVVATQTLNGQSNTATATAIISNEGTPLVYEVISSNEECGSDGAIHVFVSSGIATGFEIISGPVVRPLQTASIFEDLPSGQYEVRVHNECGDALVTTIQLFQEELYLFLGPGNFSTYGELPNCDTIRVWNYFGVNFQPYTMEYTVYPPDGSAPIILTGPDFIMEGSKAYMSIPFYNGQAYSYDVKIIDACGNMQLNSSTIDTAYSFELGGYTPSCDNFYLGIGSLRQYTLPLTVDFIEAPSGFVPTDYNASHPVFEDELISYGSDTNPLPFGDYVVQVTDGCGNTLIKELSLPLTGELFKEGMMYPNQCLGSIRVRTPFFKEITLAVITGAPEGFNNSLPFDVTVEAIGGQLLIHDLPPGIYTLQVTDECGELYEFDVEIVAPPFDPYVIADIAPGCEQNESSVRLSVSNASLETVIIVNAPDAFEEVLPLDASSNINDFGEFMMGSLPLGTYVFETVDECGNVRNKTVNLMPYTETNNTQVDFNCGSFDVDLRYTTERSPWAVFWLQKYNEETATWGHPETGVPYVSDDPNWDNSIMLTNNSMNYNLDYSGEFRILIQYLIYTFPIEMCTREIYSFETFDAPAIKGAYAFPCSDGTSEVLIDAEGMPPLLYEITEKDGEPFVLDNGESPYFMGIEDGVYNFRITDDCSNLLNIEFDITDLPPPHVVANDFCEGEDAVLSLPEFSFLTYSWWKGDAEEIPLSNTYSLTVSEFDSETDSGIYHVRITSTVPGSCIDIELSYNLTPGEPPFAGADNSIVLLSCSPNGIVNLNQYLSEGHDQGQWQDINATGALSDNILDSDLLGVGTYHFDYVVVKCNATDTASLTIKVEENEFMPVVFNAGCEGPEYHVSVVNISDFEGMSYNWSGPEGYTAEGHQIDITNRFSGDYYVTIADAEGCSITDFMHVSDTQCITTESFGTEIPKGISPGDAGFNNEFDLSGLDVKHLIIFNRYGLKVYEKENYTNEWHGQSDKGDLPTGTYYYVITLETGERHTGWVYLQRAG